MRATQKRDQDTAFSAKQNQSPSYPLQRVPMAQEGEVSWAWNVYSCDECWDSLGRVLLRLDTVEGEDFFVIDPDPGVTWHREVSLKNLCAGGGINARDPCTEDNHDHEYISRGLKEDTIEEYGLEDRFTEGRKWYIFNRWPHSSDICGVCLAGRDPETQSLYKEVREGMPDSVLFVDGNRVTFSWGGAYKPFPPRPQSRDERSDSDTDDSDTSLVSQPHSGSGSP